MVHFQLVNTSVARDEPADSPFLRTARLCLHLLVVLVPLATSDLRWTGLWDAPFTADQHDLVKVFFMRALVLVAAGGWVWHAFTRGIRLRTTGVEWVLAAFLGWVFLATIFSAHVPTAVLGKIGRYEGLLSLAAYGLLFFLTVQLVTTAAHRRALAVTLFLTGVVVSAYGILQYLGFDVVERGPLPFEANQAFATMGNPNLLAGYLLFPLTIGPVLALSETRSDRRAATDPNSPMLRLQAALTLRELGRISEATNLAEEATALDPRFADAQVVLAELYAQTGRFEEALAAYRTALSLRPDDLSLQEAIRSMEASATAGAAASSQPSTTQ